MEKVKTLLRTHWDIVSYVFFGACTTAVNYVSYVLLYDLAGISNLISTAVAWLLSVIFAYITNKLWVFESKSFDAKVLKHEIPSFLGARVFTGLLDLGIMALTVDALHMNANIWKLVSNILVIVLNYIASKALIFRK